MHTVMRHQCLHCLSTVSLSHCVCRSVYLCLSLSLSHLSVCLSVCLSVSLSLSLSLSGMCVTVSVIVSYQYRADFAIINLSIYNCTIRSLLVHVSVHSASSHYADDMNVMKARTSKESNNNFVPMSRRTVRPVHCDPRSNQLTALSGNTSVPGWRISHTPAARVETSGRVLKCACAKLKSKFDLTHNFQVTP